MNYRKSYLKWEKDKSESNEVDLAISAKNIIKLNSLFYFLTEQDIR